MSQLNTTPKERMEHTARLERLEIELIKQASSRVLADSPTAAEYVTMYRDLRIGRAV